MADREIDINNPDLDTGRTSRWTARPTIGATPQQASAAALEKAMEPLMYGVMRQYLAEARQPKKPISDEERMRIQQEIIEAGYKESVAEAALATSAFDDSPRRELNEKERAIQSNLAARYSSEEMASDVIRRRCFGFDRPLIGRVNGIAEGYANPDPSVLSTNIEAFYAWHESHQPIFNPSEEGQQQIVALRAAIDAAKQSGLFTVRAPAVG